MNPEVMNNKHWLLLIAWLSFTGFCNAQPDFKKVVEFEGIRCFMDVKDKQVAYYAPEALNLAIDEDGKPDFNFLQTRYTGSVVNSDKGETRFKSVLRFRVKMSSLPADRLSRVKKHLWPSGNGQLKPVPISDIKTQLSFMPIGDTELEDAVQLADGQFTGSDKSALNSKGQFWKEREYVVKLDNRSSQALNKAFELGQALLSLSYAFYSQGVSQLDAEIYTEGESKVLETIQSEIAANEDSVTLERVCVRSDAFSIAIDKERWPDLFRQIDINEEVPPGYAALEVRCYDFNNELRADLFVRTIEVKAKGVGRGDVLVKASFSRKAPDVYVLYLRFPYAVRLDQPFYYRTISISDQAAPVKSDWKEQSLWSGLIDITSAKSEWVVNEED
jgi:hypothetical protein